MMAKLVRAAAVALLVLVMAVTPLSAFLNGGRFETSWPGDRLHGPVLVLLDDHTGFVKGVSPAPASPGVRNGVTNLNSDPRVLSVSVEGSSCDHVIRLEFARTDTGFVVRERTEEYGFCVIGMGAAWPIAIVLWSPIDASVVAFVSLD